MNYIYDPKSNTGCAIPEGNLMRDSVCTIDSCSIRTLHGVSGEIIQTVFDLWKSHQKVTP